MRPFPWWSQLRYRLLAIFVLVVLVNGLYSEYAVGRTLNTELPQVALQTLALHGARLAAQLEQAYTVHGQLSTKVLDQPPQVAMRLYDAQGQRLEASSPLSPQATTVTQALHGTSRAPTIVLNGSQRYGYEALPLIARGKLIGVLEVAEELPALDRFQTAMQAQIATTAIVSLCSLLAVAVYLGNRLSQSLHHIRQQTRAIVNGDFDHRLSIKSHDEIAQIGLDLNQMAEELQQLAKTRNEFLSKVSHELRTPLTIAKGFSSLLQRQITEPAQMRQVTIIDGQIDDLTRLVNDLLDLSRRQDGALNLHAEELDCRTLLADVAERQRQVLRGQKVTLETRFRVQHALIKGDAQRLHQVLGNLIGNASRYSRGHIWLELDTDAEHAIIRVSDDGLGIAPEDQARIFEPFFQASRGPRGKAGLGLAVARELVLAHEGTISVESVVGSGTTFKLALPLIPEQNQTKRRSRRFLSSARIVRKRSNTAIYEATPTPSEQS
ncbi:MAG: HAMP domain-containing histidine kinase [Herpetosiphonaceae bacterium]|nr:HAMP domain-containing histidine kinase [Herpetosiphonaceae bacterium]